MARVHEKSDLRVAVVGCGRGGCAIAGEFVRRGCSVLLYDNTEYTRARAFQTLRASLYDHVASGYLLKPDVDELIGRITLAHSLPEALEKSQLVVESVFEDLQLKRELFNQMGEILKQRASPASQDDGPPVILCSNTMDLSMSDITEDMCKEHRGSCVGMRFLHPVWFVDEVELADCDYTRRATTAAAERLLKRLFFQPFFFDGCYRRKLTLQEITTYQSRQRLRCPEPMPALPKRGIRKKSAGGSPSPEKLLAMSPEGASPVAKEQKEEGAVPAGGMAALSVAEEEPPEPCAVCLEEPRSALLVPCGHIAMCVDCAEKVPPPPPRPPPRPPPPRTCPPRCAHPISHPRAPASPRCSTARSRSASSAASRSRRFSAPRRRRERALAAAPPARPRPG